MHRENGFNRILPIYLLTIALATLQVAAQAQTPPTAVQPPSTAPAPSDPCDGIECSGNGRCVTQNESPVCACHAGFQADGTRLNCIPILTASIPPTRTSAPPSIANIEDEKRARRAAVAQQEYRLIKDALPEFSHDEHFIRYNRYINWGLSPGSFIDYRIDRAQKYKAGGAVLIGIGATLVISAIPLLIMIPITNSDYDDYSYGYARVYYDSGHLSEETIIFISSGVSSLCIGTPFLATGIVRFLRAKRLLKGLNSLKAVANQNVSGAPVFHFIPLVAPHSGVFGLSGVMLF